MERLPFRIAGPKDTEEITALINAAFSVERFFIDGDRTDPDEVRAFLERGKFLVMEEDGRMIACAYVERREDRGYLGLLSVDPQRKGLGIGARLVAEAENYCRGAGCRVMDLKIVDVRAELPGFYRRLGYVESGTAPFPADVVTKIPCQFVLMTKSLEPA